MSDTTNPTSQHKHTNRLINETSPYLLQHAHNPVDWYPWGEEALQKAQQEDKPILLFASLLANEPINLALRKSVANARKFSPGTKLDGSFFVPRAGRLTRVTLAADTTTIAVGNSAQFTAQAYDQFDRAHHGA